MILTKAATHQHTFKGFKVIDVVADNPKYRIADNGVKAIVLRVCSCGHGQAFDYGGRKIIHELFNQLSSETKEE